MGDIINVVPVAPYPSWQVDEGDANIWTVTSALASLGYTCTQQTSPNDSGGHDYQMSLSHADYPQLTAPVGYWIVVGNQQAYVYDNDTMLARYKAA